MTTPAIQRVRASASSRSGSRHQAGVPPGTSSRA
ncbi:hypothetical protein J2S57_006580 [Kineosporia succinea]|uniref:Uncharacterized protein n=1 Tax=Kineosporia succinea TaxID=84632 RepID=A0ABT9PDP3_9ACTN|nr:hypothetical protein [Kineosporia succinea]